MGFGTTLFTNIYFSHKCYRSLNEVREDIKDKEQWLEDSKERIRLLVTITEPKKFMSDEETDPMHWLMSEVNDQLDLIQEYTQELEKLYRLEEAWERVTDENGLEKLPDPSWNLFHNSYKHTDFMDGVYPDGTIYRYRQDLGIEEE